VYEVYGDALVGIFSTIFTFAILIFSEIIPKTIGANYWRSLAIPASAIINMMIFISFPLVWVLEKLQRLISSKSNQVSVSREDISAMVSVATEEEVIETEEKKMIQNLLKLDEMTAHEIMTPSTVVEMAEGQMTIREFYDSDLTHSRILVYDEDNDEYVIGYVLRQTVLEEMAEDKFSTTIREISRPILTFPENEPVGNIWEKFLEKKEHISVIIDEYGTFRGIVTMEDVIETMGHLDDATINKITHENAMAAYSFDPFKHVPKEHARAGYLRSQATDVDVVTHVGRQASQRDRDAWARMVSFGQARGAQAAEPATSTSP
jgi:CBS domain containing-hemolysin-like protein